MIDIDNKLILENSKNLNVLYVEDEELLRNSSAQLFSNFFNRVDVGVDGEDGYKRYKEYLEDTGTRYDLVISDINMPNMNGLEMSQKIKDICIEQVIIIVTAFNEVEYFHKAINLGLNGFLTKPIEMEQLKKVFYTTTQIVTDRKFVKNHYEQIEEENILSIDVKSSKGLDSAKDILDDLVKNKEKISVLWTNKQNVQEKLESHTIDVEFFRSHYAIKVIEYFLNVIREDEELGNCPVIFTMLDFFKHKNLPLEDIFIICVIFKNTITAYIFDRYTFNHSLFDDISLILDKNFEGVVINYMKMKGAIKEINHLSEPVIIESKDDETQEYISYIDYVLESDIYELEELEEDIDNLSIIVTEKSSATIDDTYMLGDKTYRYGVILSNYPLFAELGKCITKLGVNISNNSEVLYKDRNKMLNISALVEGFVNDLIVWRKEIFENNIDNPQFLDKSFFSNVDTIIMFIEYDETTEVEEDNFDDMFF